jgi:hypothetical protein
MHAQGERVGLHGSQMHPKWDAPQLVKMIFYHPALNQHPFNQLIALSNRRTGLSNLMSAAINKVGRDLLNQIKTIVNIYEKCLFFSFGLRLQTKLLNRLFTVNVVKMKHLHGQVK